ncbi:MAG: ABC transporter substrate-binding protein [Snodgrassella sp.]|jgi:putative tryptophan/tyrosine transport system substrate-binding protein|uniref:ABC transporter substrate-binding protein n=1 Tax=Snodgrassella alvi TaxID=1196083 RepID=A0A2N9XII6_9NEIS|nr:MULTISPECIES: ABC transporter substrate-binding protein [Snodgrassella]MCO6505531.1 ABC transporter substrate-binding protein [Snodgrassella sp.]MCO6512941.1 ABC transporter substrate-binding protein [Snodgrassella sp.]MCO6516395.1 ABC transporter substrate-binding protein [Snodgrassella sp.]MCO6518343.1 ABC transporter substrate-binding protein [Snodgrassella sp.]MCO6520084.1 ABC transporter substrate-binding protein [Snodgrassella sp.]
MLGAKKKLLILGLSAACLLTACSPSEQGSKSSDNGMKKVAITAIVEHPALDAVRQGVIDELRAEGYEQGKNLQLDFQSAQGNTATAGQIAKKFAGSNPDAIVTIGTPSAQSMVAATRKIPVVFAAVTDPVAAKLVANWEPSKTNVTGVSDELPLQPQIDLMKQVVPNLKTVGYVYSPGEVNSTVVLGQLQTLLAKDGINVAAVPAQRTTDVPIATKSLQGKANLIYTSLDNNVVSAYESMFKVAKNMKMPLVASDTGSVKRGAAVAMGVNYHELGVATGKIVGRILKGEQAGNIAPQRMSVEQLDLMVSKSNAAEQGITLSPELLKQATVID